MDTLTSKISHLSGKIISLVAGWVGNTCPEILQEEQEEPAKHIRFFNRVQTRSYDSDKMPTTTPPWRNGRRAFVAGLRRSRRTRLKGILKKRNRTPRDIGLVDAYTYYIHEMAEQHSRGVLYGVVDVSLLPGYIARSWLTLERKQPYLKRERRNLKEYLKEYEILNNIIPGSCASNQILDPKKHHQ